MSGEEKTSPKGEKAPEQPGEDGFRRARPEDLPAILAFVGQAKAYFKRAGIDQWQNGYPNTEVISGDIVRGQSYVYVWNGRVAGTAAVLPAPEKTYAVITEGSWLGGPDYIVVHRIAVDESLKGRGIAGLLLRGVETLCRAGGRSGIRADTHEQNASMRRLLQKNGFRLCGKIFLEDGSERVAYEKRL